MTTTSARHYPAVCPKCDCEKGFPYQVRTLTDKSGAIEVKMRCRECAHEWVELIVNNE